MTSYLRSLCVPLGLTTFLAIAPLTLLSGCDDDEEVLDIETPNSEIEIERDDDTGALEIDE